MQQQRALAARGGLRSSHQQQQLPAALLASSRRARGSRLQRRALPPLAMVNVDFASPSLVLGVTLIGCGIALLQVRNMQREVSRDADIVVAAMISIVGSTLIFQGWRLDPLLLLCQALTTSVAFWYGLEAFKLRAEVVQDEEDQGVDGGMPPQLPPLDSQMRGGAADFPQATRPGSLPAGADRQMPPWAAAQQQQQPGLRGAGGGGRWGLPPPEQAAVRYDAYAQGAPEAMYAQQAYEEQQAGGPSGYGPGGGPYEAGGMYGQQQQQQYGQQLPPMQQQQPQQYEWPQQGPGAPGGAYQQPGAWPPLGPGMGGVDAYGQPQQPQQQLPYPGQGGPDDPYAAAAAGVGGGGVLPDGSLGPYGMLPPGEQQQQQQQRQQQARRQGGKAVPGGYEQVDDWE